MICFYEFMSLLDEAVTDFWNLLLVKIVVV